MKIFPVSVRGIFFCILTFYVKNTIIGLININYENGG